MSIKINKIYVGNIQPWNSWTGIDTCKLCGIKGLSTSFEFHYRINDGDDIYIREACRDCTKELMDQDEEYCSPERWKRLIDEGKNTFVVYHSHGLINDYVLHMIQYC